MNELIILLPEKPNILLKKMIKQFVANRSYKTIYTKDNLPDLNNKKILFAVELNEIGTSNNLNNMLLELFERGNDSLIDSEAAVLIHSDYKLFTKTTAQSIIFLSNSLGCSFIGRPLVEATGDLDNFIPMTKIYDLSLEEICLKQCHDLGKRFFSSLKKEVGKNKKLLVLHSSNREISNTLSLWDMVKSNLDNIEIEEINLGNGNISDCKGCPYTTCKFLGMQSRCFYGGIIVEEVYPAILNADSILFICPNYNDMIVANLVATINRLTALYRKTKFYDKSIFSIIVSGYSGGDAIAKQLISSLNINKTFKLPAYFSLMATANDKGSIFKVDNIEEKAKSFAKIIKNNFN